MANRRSPSQEIAEIPHEDGSLEFQTIPSSEPDLKQPVNIYSRFKSAFLPASTLLNASAVECHSTKATQTSCIPRRRSKSASRPIVVWRHSSPAMPSAEMQLVSTSNSTSNSTGEQRTVRRLRRDKRAATSLFTLVLVFMIFLLPYVFVVVVGKVFSIESLTNTNGPIYSAAFWLLWLNSTINPILYPFIQPRFREAYRKLFLRFTRRQRRLAALIVDIQRGK